MKIEVENSQFISVYIYVYAHVDIYSYIHIYTFLLSRLLYLVFLRSNYSCIAGFKFPLSYDSILSTDKILTVSINIKVQRKGS